MKNLVSHWQRASVNLGLVANAARSGVVSIGDVLAVADRLDRQGSEDPSAWVDAWTDVASAWLERAAQGEADGERARLHSGYASLIADRLMVDGEKREAAYRSSIGLIADSLGGFGLPCERIEIPYLGGALPGLWMSGGSSTTVVFFPGLDTTKELWLALAGPDLARIGVNTLFLDGPGQGEALRVNGLTLRHDTEVVLDAALRWLADHHPAVAARAVVAGASFGGYLAARAAAYTDGLAGAVIWGAVWDYHAVWSARLRGAAGSPVEFGHICRMTGTGDAAAAVEQLRPFTMVGHAQHIDLPVLILHGGSDRQVPQSQAHRLFRSITAGDKTLVVFEGEGGGAAHVQVDNLAVGTSRINAWLRERAPREQCSDDADAEDHGTGESSGQ